MTISNEAVEAAVKAWDHHWGDRYGDEALEEMGEEVRIALEAAAPFIRAEALEEAAEVAHDNISGMDGSAIRATEDRGFMQRHNVSAAARWLRARATEMRGSND